MGEASRTARCHPPPIPPWASRPMSAPRSIRLTLALFVLGGVVASIGVVPVDPAAASADAVPAVHGSGVQVVSGTGELSSVACATSSSCVAVGSMNGEGVVVSIHDGVPGPAQALPGTDGLVSVACTSARSCIAVGTEPYSDEPMPPWTVGVVVGIDDGQAFVGGPITGNGLPGAPDYVYPSGVSCSGTTHYCLAVGRSTYEDGFVDDIGEGGSGVVQSISPLAINGVECPKDDWCLVDGQKFVQIVNGQLRGGPGAVFPGKTNLSAGACHREDLEFCLVAGVDGRKPAEGAVFSVVGESSGFMRDVPGTSTLNDLACSGNYWCVAVGQSTAGGGAIVPVGWESPGAARAVTGIDGFSGVSCPTSQFCVAVGAEGPSNGSTGIMDTFPIRG
jgi:hypothetical protein